MALSAQLHVYFLPFKTIIAHGATTTVTHFKNHGFTFTSIFSVLVIPKCGRLSWPAVWSNFGRTTTQFDWINWWNGE